MLKERNAQKTKANRNIGGIWNEDIIVKIKTRAKNIETEKF